MRKNQVQAVVVHPADGAESGALAARVNAFQVEIIERRLRRSALTAEQQIAVIERIVEWRRVQGIPSCEAGKSN